jgi:hypothetical protein
MASTQDAQYLTIAEKEYDCLDKAKAKRDGVKTFVVRATSTKSAEEESIGSKQK